MVATLVVFLLFALVLYAYTNHKRQFEAAASAICQIWSGSCRLSCRQSGSGFSGLSGLAKPQNVLDTEPVSIQSNAGPSNDCTCESCPCALIENVLRTCRSATNLYTQTIKIVSSSYYNAVKTLSDFYRNIERVADCGVSCQRQAQLLSIRDLGSVNNINFVNQTAVRANSQYEDAAPSKDASNLRSPSKMKISFRKKSVVGTQSEAKNDALQNPIDNLIQMEASTCCSASNSSENTTVGLRNCSRCIEKGITCMGGCPRASGERNEKNKKDKK